MLINQNMKLADVIHHDYTLVPVINRFGIHLGFGNYTIREICKKHNVSADFFVIILNAFHDPHYFPKERLQSIQLSILIEYLQKAHTDFLEDKIPEIAFLIEKMPDKCFDDRETYLLIRNFFDEYSAELKSHINREEERVYPYVLMLEDAFLKGKMNVEIEKKIRDYPISAYKAEHENVEEKSFDLKNIIIKYLPKPKSDKLCFQLLREIFSLEKELNEHARIEDLIIVPKVETMENALKLKGFGNE